LLVLMVDSGARISELLALTWADLDLAAGTMTIRGGKTPSAARVVALEAVTVAELRRWHLASGRRAGVVFPVHRGTAANGYGRAATAAGIKNVSPRTIRHSVDTWAISAGATASGVAARLGHRSAAFTLQRYVHPGRADDAAALTALSAWKATQGS
jgi:integrase